MINQIGINNDTPVIQHKKPVIHVEKDPHLTGVDDPQDSVEIRGKHKYRLHREEEISKTHQAIEGLHVGAEAVESAEIGGVLGEVAGVAGGIAGAYFTVEGFKDLKTAIKEKNAIEATAAVGHIALGTEGLGGLAQEAVGLKAVSGFVGPGVAAVLTSPVFSAVLTGAGVVHGAAEIAVGSTKVYHGIKEGDKKQTVKGLIDMGMGASAGAIALGAGLPAGIALIGLFGAKLWIDRKQVKEQAVKLFNNVKMKIFTPQPPQIENIDSSPIK